MSGVEEPSVLDYVKSLLMPWRKKITLPAEPSGQEQVAKTGMEVLQPENVMEKVTERKPVFWPWRALLTLVLALAAQSQFEPPEQNLTLGLVFYLFSMVFLIWAVISKEWTIAELPEDSSHPFSFSIRRYFLWFSIPLILISFILFGGNQFTSLNLLVWLLTLGYGVWALWLPQGGKIAGKLWHKLIAFIRKPELRFHISSWQLLVLLAGALVVFFRFVDLAGVPGEMFSDHAEKLLDVSNVLSGEYSIFFPRNTGREAIQMYLTAAVALVLKTGISFMSLKIGTVLAGLLTLPYIYLLGKEVGNRWVGLFALVLAGIGYWPNVISRIGLRFPLYALFAAPVLYYLMRGLRTMNRNDFVLCGLALGLGLHGYSPMRIVPFVIVVLVIIYILHKQAAGKRLHVVVAIGIIAFVSFLVFIPLLRYMVDNPDMFSYRVLTRLGTEERPYPGPVWQIFLSNLWKAEVMFFWKNGSIWVHSIPDRPALDVVTGALYFVGTVLILIRYMRQRRWQDLFLILAVPLLMLPSILSLAFPDENPSLNRTSAAIVPVFTIAAIALEGFLRGMYHRATSNWGRVITVLVALVILFGSAMQNYELVMVRFKQQFLAGAWNTSEIGQVIRGFADSVGDRDTAFVVPYPHWVDTRLVGINAGYPEKDYALWPEDFEQTLAEPRNKLFIVKPENQPALDKLRQLYPDGVLTLHKAALPGKDFLIFLVPARQEGQP
ncbi:MAG: glycosyltransferase family 39 protein [Anaerolineales bacterium]